MLVARASTHTRAAFFDYIELLGRSEIEGPDFEEARRLAESLAELQAKSAISIAVTESKLQVLLATTNRTRVRDLQFVGSLPDGPAYARFVWILGVSGSSDQAATGTLRNFLLCAAEWYAESLIALLANPAESNLLAISHKARHQRMEGGGVRYRWVCDLFARGVDAWATERGGRAAELFGCGRTRNLSAAIGEALPFPNESVLSGVHPEVLTVLSSPTMPTGKVAALIEGNGPGTRPLFELDDTTLIGNAAALVLSLETVLMAAIKETLGARAQGDAFEFACAYVARHLTPPTIHVARDSFVADTITAKDGDEVDLNLHGRGLEVVVEAKSHLPAKDASAAANSFEELLKANKQILTRVSRLRSGGWIRRKRVSREDAVSGLVVTLHDYTSQVWVPESMVESGVDAFIAMPIHAFAMALGCMRSPAELGDFLSVRAAIGEARASGGMS